jgi:hypothetical protein
MGLYGCGYFSNKRSSALRKLRVTSVVKKEGAEQIFHDEQLMDDYEEEQIVTR